MIARWSREGLEEAAKVRRGHWHREAALSWIADRREDASIRAHMGQHGAELDDDSRSTGQDLLEARLALYRQQARGQEIRNSAAEAQLVPREKAIGTYAETQARIIARGDAWARDPNTEAAKPLLERLSPAAVIQLKAELWHELRAQHADVIRVLETHLAHGEDVGSTRIRLSG